MQVLWNILTVPGSSWDERERSSIQDKHQSGQDKSNQIRKKNKSKGKQIKNPPFLFFFFFSSYWNPLPNLPSLPLFFFFFFFKVWWIHSVSVMKTTRKVKESNIVQGKGVSNPLISFEIKDASSINYQFLLWTVEHEHHQSMSSKQWFWESCHKIDDELRRL